MLPIAKESYPGIILLSVITIGFAAINWFLPSIITGIVLIGIVLFFRDPNRRTIQDPTVIFSPADGRILSISTSEINGVPVHHIGIFLSVFNCHINRIPYDGKITEVTRCSGQFLAAYQPGIETKNSRCSITLDTRKGPMRVVQITGAIARRIVCRPAVGDLVSQNDRFGLIMFGSRTDIYFPISATALVSIGDRVQAGTTPLARF